MAGKKKAAKKVSKNGKKIGRPKKADNDNYVFAVVDAQDPRFTLNEFSSLDAASDAIDAQDKLHLDLESIARNVSDADISLMAEGEPLPAVKPLTQIDWTIIKRKSLSAIHDKF